MSMLTNIQEIQQEEKIVRTPACRVPATAVLHGRLQNEKGEDLGSLLNLMVNVHTGKIEYAVIQFGAFLGFGGKLFAIPFRQLRLDLDRGIFVLNRPRADFESMPGFDKNHWPDTNAHYLININALWNTAVAVQF